MRDTAHSEFNSQNTLLSVNKQLYLHHYNSSPAGSAVRDFFNRFVQRLSHMRKIAGFCLFIFYCFAGYSQEHDTLHVYFPLDKTNLTDLSVKFMDSLVSNRVLKSGTRIILLGYGDYLGDNDYKCR